MPDTNREKQQNRGQQQGSPSPQDPKEGTPSEDRARPSRESSIASDRERGDEENRRFRGSRENDELGSEVERETGIESEDDEDQNSPGGRSNR